MLYANKAQDVIRFTFILSLCFLLSSCVTPCAWQNYECTPADDSIKEPNDLSKKEKELSLLLNQNESIELAKDQIVKIQLQANPTTGYTWEALEKNDGGTVSQLGESEYMPGSQAKEKLVGAGGIQIYRFKALNKGIATIVFEYKRSWEKDQEPAKKYILEVRVK